jgi:hypothetical protein
MTLYIDTKPTLEWVEYGQHHYADIYEIERLSVDRETCFIIIAGVVDTPPYYDTVAEAKIAAQLDYERRTAERFKAITLPPRMDARQGDGAVHYCTGWNDVLDAIAKAREATP